MATASSGASRAAEASSKRASTVPTVLHSTGPEAAAGATELLLDLGRPVGLVAHRVPHDDALAEELHQVLVRSEDHDGQILLQREPHGGRDEIVGLDSVFLEDRNAVRLHDLTRSLHL